MNTQQIREFILAGNALFTFKSLRTGEHYTFRVVLQTYWSAKLNKAIPRDPPQWDVKVLSGRDNSRDYKWIGRIRGYDRTFYGGLHRTDSFDGFAWCWNHLDRCGERFEFNHAGRCGRCGRLLTTPESVERGIGPECQDKMAFEAMGGAEGLLGQLFGG